MNRLCKGKYIDTYMKKISHLVANLFDRYEYKPLWLLIFFSCGDEMAGKADEGAISVAPSHPFFDHLPVSRHRDMANLSSSWESATVGNQTPISKNRAQSPISRSTTPVPKAGEPATIVAFKNARETFQKSLSPKDQKSIMVPTRPEDIVTEIEKWRKKHSDSKFAAGVRSGLGQLQRFSASIDMLAQGTPSPGCLLWGSIKFVLTVSRRVIVTLCRSIDSYGPSDRLSPTPNLARKWVFILEDHPQ